MAAVSLYPEEDILVPPAYLGRPGQRSHQKHAGPASRGVCLLFFFLYYKTKMDQHFAYTLIDFYLAVLSLRCCGGFPLVAASQGYSLVGVLGLLIAVTSPGVAPGL